MHQANAHQGQAAAWPPEPKEKARPTTTPSEPHHNKRHTPATVAPDCPDSKSFSDTCASFARLGYELRRHTTESGLVHRIFDEDATPKPSKGSGRTTFIVGHWTGPRHLASWHGVVAMLATMQDAARG